jgi:hypothetical protein
MVGGGIEFGMRNRLINGAMVIDQRNNGASLTPTGSVYTLDRWATFITQASKISFQQNAASVTPPSGFTKYLGATSLSSYSVLSSDSFSVSQPIEGLNIADLGWGTASAATVTLSFWVRSSLTGTFGGSLRNGAVNRSYPFTYTINSANTWEKETITIAGDTTGTWATDNTQGVYVGFALGAGATLSNTAGAWAAGNFASATGATSVVGTNGATFYITGVQLEKGSAATPFDYRPYGTELQLCQRYYWNWSQGQFARFCIAYNDATTTLQIPFFISVPLRANPTATFTNMTSNGTSITATGVSASNSAVWVTASGSGLTVGATQIYVASGTTGIVALSAEL